MACFSAVNLAHQCDHACRPICCTAPSTVKKNVQVPQPLTLLQCMKPRVFAGEIFTIVALHALAVFLFLTLSTVRYALQVGQWRAAPFLQRAEGDPGITPCRRMPPKELLHAAAQSGVVVDHHHPFCSSRDCDECGQQLPHVPTPQETRSAESQQSSTTQCIPPVSTDWLLCYMSHHTIATYDLFYACRQITLAHRPYGDAAGGSDMLGRGIADCLQNLFQAIERRPSLEGISITGTMKASSSLSYQEPLCTALDCISPSSAWVETSSAAHPSASTAMPANLITKHLRSPDTLLTL